MKEKGRGEWRVKDRGKGRPYLDCGG
jgi:hypothetical protein